jgi:phosphatidylglycerol:prolipoprotein diacylglycerol transferase
MIWKASRPLPREIPKNLALPAWYHTVVIAFYLPGEYPVYAFSLIIALGAVVGLTWVAAQVPRPKVLTHVNAGIWSCLGALIGSRLVYVGANWAYFNGHALESVQIFQGGLSWVGALGGAILALWAYARLERLPLPALSDTLLPLGACLALSAWIGCWFDGCAYGPATHAWWGIPAWDEWGSLTTRFPTQVLGALYTLALFWLLEQPPRSASKGSNRMPAGQPASLALLGFTLAMFLLSFLRGDPGLTWLGLRLDAWGAIGFVVMAAWLLWRSRQSQQAQLQQAAQES